VLTAAFSILGTRDYLMRHRVRWSMLSTLMDTGVMPHRIDGGFEFNAWHNDGDPRIASEKYRKHMDTEQRRKWQRRVIDDEYIASHEPFIPGYQMIETNSYTRLMPPGVESVYLFQRNTAGPAGQPSPNHLTR